jgi:hypothetical protein
MNSSRVPDYEEVSPYVLLRELSELALNRIPECLQSYSTSSGLKAWELLEDGVFYFFRQILMFETLRMGAQSLFCHEPEGIVLVNRDCNPFALMYECKARASSYICTADDVLRYKDYIRQQKRKVKEKQHLELTHFVIVSSSFGGKLEERLHALEAEGIVPCFVPAVHLSCAAKILRRLDFSDVQLFDLRRLFRRGVVHVEVIRDCFGPEDISVAMTSDSDRLDARTISDC